MTSHVHLLITAERAAGVPQVMKRLGLRYVQHINRRYQRYAVYRRLFETELDASLLQRLRDCTNSGFVLGNERFTLQIAAFVPSFLTSSAC